MNDALSHAQIAAIYRRATADGPGSLSEAEWVALPPQDQVALTRYWDREIRLLAAHVAHVEALAAKLTREPGEEG